MNFWEGSVVLIDLASGFIVFLFCIVLKYGPDVIKSQLLVGK